jgi:GT2 family glycosyltransferase
MTNDWESINSSHFDIRPVIEDISIVIPTLGRAILEGCLYWLASGSTWPGELIIVDQGQNPQVKEWLKRLGEIGFHNYYLPSNQRGRAAGINRGLDQVRTQFIAITDDDCFVDHAWLERIVEALHRTPERIITGRVEPAGKGDVDFCVVTSREPKIYLKNQLKVHPLIGGNIGVSMENVNKIGPFDEHPSIFSAEDSDWGYRALRKGIPIVYDPDIMIRHYNWRDSGQRGKRYRDYSRSQGAYYGKYLLSGDLLILLQTLRDLVRGPIRWVRGLVKGNQDMIDRGRADSLELIPGIIAGVRRRKIL